MVTEPGVPPRPGLGRAPAPTMVQALVDHARAEYPNEMCGLIVGDRPAAAGGVAAPLGADPQPGRQPATATRSIRTTCSG